MHRRKPLSPSSNGHTNSPGKTERKQLILAFNDPNGEFARGELYIFAYDYTGTTLVLPHEPAIVGTNRLDLRDANGVAYIREMIGVVENGSGFVRYYYPNPEADFSIEPKLSYVMRVDDTWWLGAGIYGEEAESASPQVEADLQAKEQIVRFVEDAAAYARTNGREAALAAFMDKNGPFVMREVYIYALDFNGTCLALPYQQDLVGTSMIDLKDTYGVNVTRVEIDLAKEGGGFIFYDYPNPAHNLTVEPKMSYVQKVDETWWLGAGIYLADLTENSLATRSGMQTLLTGIEGGVEASLTAVDANLSEAARHFGAAGMEGEGTAGVLEYLVASSPAAVDAVTVGPGGRILAVAPEEYPRKYRHRYQRTDPYRPDPERRRTGAERRVHHRRGIRRRRHRPPRHLAFRRYHGRHLSSVQAGSAPRRRHLSGGERHRYRGDGYPDGRAGALRSRSGRDREDDLRGSDLRGLPGPAGDRAAGCRRA